MVHFQTEFKEKYMQGMQVSSSIEGNCSLCSYVGKTRDLIFHVGAAHGKLKEFLPSEVWSRLFGHQVRKFKPVSVRNHTKKATKVVRPSRAKGKVSLRHVLPRINGKDNRARKPLSVTREQSKVAAGLTRSAPASKDEDRQTFQCRQCKFSSKRFDVRRHYFTHYKEAMYAKYLPAQKPVSGKPAAAGPDDLPQCERCGFTTTPLALLSHIWCYHGAAKEFIPRSVWQELRPVVTSRSRKAASASSTAGSRKSSAKIPAKGAASKSTKSTTCFDSPSKKARVPGDADDSTGHRGLSDVKKRSSSTGSHQQKVEDVTICNVVEQEGRILEEHMVREQQMENGRQNMMVEQQRTEDEKGKTECEQPEADQQEQIDDEDDQGFDLLSNASEHKEEVIDIDEMEIDVDHCNVDVLFSANNPDLWDCTFCFQKFESSNRLRRHLILDHFAEKMCHGYRVLH